MCYLVHCTVYCSCSCLKYLGRSNRDWHFYRHPGDSHFRRNDLESYDDGGTKATQYLYHYCSQAHGTVDVIEYSIAYLNGNELGLLETPVRKHLAIVNMKFRV